MTESRAMNDLMIAVLKERITEARSGNDTARMAERVNGMFIVLLTINDGSDEMRDLIKYAHDTIRSLAVSSVDGM